MVKTVRPPAAVICALVLTRETVLMNELFNRTLMITIHQGLVFSLSSNQPAAGGDVSPVQPPRNDRRWHSNSLTGKRYRRPASRLLGLFWWTCHSRRRWGEELINRMLMYMWIKWCVRKNAEKVDGCWSETYCSHIHPSGRGSRALHRTDNWLGCRYDRSGTQTAQEHICHWDLWWLQWREQWEIHSRGW